MYDIYIKQFTNCVLVTPVFLNKAKKKIETFLYLSFNKKEMVYRRLQDNSLNIKVELRNCRKVYISKFNKKYKLPA